MCYSVVSFSTDVANFVNESESGFSTYTNASSLIFIIINFTLKFQLSSLWLKRILPSLVFALWTINWWKHCLISNIHSSICNLPSLEVIMKVQKPCQPLSLSSLILLIDGRAAYIHALDMCNLMARKGRKKEQSGPYTSYMLLMITIS